MTTLRIRIDGPWSAQEFADFFEALQALSFYGIADMEYRFAPSTTRRQSIAHLRKNNATLNVSKIQYGSPGFTDLVGFGAILSELRQFLEFLVQHVSQANDRRLDREVKRLEILQKKIEIAKELDRLEISHSIAKLIDSESAEVLIEAVRDGRLLSAEIFEGDPE